MGRSAAAVLAQARRAAGLSQAELAARAGIQRTAVAMYETGAREPGAGVFLRLLAATGAAVETGRPAGTIDCWRNSAVFVSLTSVLDAVPVGATGPLAFPADVWGGRG